MAFTYRITSWKAHRAGRSDGKRKYPPAEWDGTAGKISEFEKQLAAVLKSHWDGIVERWQADSTTYLLKMKTLEPSLGNSLTRYRRCLAECRQRFGETAAPEPRHKFTLGAWLLLFLLFAIEAGINIYTFQYLREPGITTIALGATLAILIPLSGFFAGRIFKQKENTLVEKITGATLLLLGILLLLVVAMGRKTAAAAKSLSPEIVNEVYLMFLVANALLFGIAFWDGFRSSYTYPELQKVFTDLNLRKRQYVNLWGRLKDAAQDAVSRVDQIGNQARSLQIQYQRGNRKGRESRSGNGNNLELPAYFAAEAPLPAQHPQQIREMMMVADPGDHYIRQIMQRSEYQFMKSAEERIQQINAEIENPGRTDS